MREGHRGASLWTGTPLRTLDEDELLGRILPGMPRSPALLVPPGDDAAVVATGPATVATTDAMVLGRDWRDDWSTGADVGHKLVTMNLADVAAMGAVSTGVLVTLAIDPGASVEWAEQFAAGVAAASRAAGVAVLGGDLSSAPDGVVMVSITALGDQAGPPVLRSGAGPGDEVAVRGTLGFSGAGLYLLERGAGPQAPEGSPVALHRRPVSDLSAGPAAARGGATAMIDVSDGLLRDAGRIARASGVVLDLHSRLLAPFERALVPFVPEHVARDCVRSGGEEHSLLATFPAGQVPAGWSPLGVVRAVQEAPDAAGLACVDGRVGQVVGWDHFRAGSLTQPPS